MNSEMLGQGQPQPAPQQLVADVPFSVDLDVVVMLFLQRDDLDPEIDFLLRWREHAVDDVDVGRLGAAERNEIADVAVLDPEGLKALKYVQRHQVDEERPSHPGTTAQ